MQRNELLVGWIKEEVYVTSHVFTEGFALVMVVGEITYNLQDDNFFPPKRRKRRSILQGTNYRRPLFKKHKFNIDTSGIDLAQLQ